nr:hypothetical protein CFP56_73990 [Quercus suber]
MSISVVYRKRLCDRLVWSLLSRTSTTACSHACHEHDFAITMMNERPDWWEIRHVDPDVARCARAQTGEATVPMTDCADADNNWDEGLWGPNLFRSTVHTLQSVAEWNAIAVWTVRGQIKDLWGPLSGIVVCQVVSYEFKCNSNFCAAYDLSNTYSPIRTAVVRRPTVHTCYDLQDAARRMERNVGEIMAAVYRLVTLIGFGFWRHCGLNPGQTKGSRSKDEPGMPAGLSSALSCVISSLAAWALQRHGVPVGHSSPKFDCPENRSVNGAVLGMRRMKLMQAQHRESLLGAT